MGSTAVDSNGNSDHTEALYREHGAAVAALCRSLLRDRGEAEDATQQVFLSAHRALLNGTVPREPLAWLMAVARNECYGRFRQRAATPVPAGDAAEKATADASVHALRAGELASIWDEVGRMPPAQREAFLLREIRGLSYGQLAAELSLSPPSVRSLLLRARTRLRHRLGDVAAGLGGAQWVQALLRIVGGGDGPSPVPAATKAAAVGLGALALVSSGDAPRVLHHGSTPRGQAAVHHRAVARARRVAVPPVTATVAREDRRSEHSGRRDDGSAGSGFRGGSDDTVVATSGPSGESRSDGSTNSGSSQDTTTTTSTQSSSGSGSGRSGRDSGSDGGSGSLTIATSSGSGSSGSSGSGESTTSDGGSGHNGGSGSD
jgi:RNA polymerase sigma-70 factor, ECF subfamily